MRSRSSAFSTRSAAQVASASRLMVASSRLQLGALFLRLRQFPFEQGLFGFQIAGRLALAVAESRDLGAQIRLGAAHVSISLRSRSHS